MLKHWREKRLLCHGSKWSLLQVIESDEWYTSSSHPMGENLGCTIGCSNIEKSKELYADILGYDEVVYDESGVFADWKTYLEEKGDIVAYY